MGGRSSEREISLKSGRAVLAALRASGVDAVAIDAASDITRAVKRHGVKKIFVALHGRWGEDGSVQGLLELLQIPYTGSGVLASALCMDKRATKIFLRQHGIATPCFEIITFDGAGRASKSDLLKKALKPDNMKKVVVKPLAEGSTLGLTIVKKKSALTSALKEARRYGKEVMVERYVEGREVTVGVIDGEALPIVEIEPNDGFYDYKAKYIKGNVNFTVPAPLGRALSAKVEKAALLSYSALGCRGAARVDIIIDKKGAPQVLEVNTIPGLTETSLLPMAARAGGMSYSKLVKEILKGARLG